MEEKEQYQNLQKTEAKKSEPDTKRLAHAPDPRGKSDLQIDTDLDNY